MNGHKEPIRRTNITTDEIDGNFDNHDLIYSEPEIMEETFDKIKKARDHL